MNMELMERVAQWLEAGAPHEMSGGMGFDMEYEGVELMADDPWRKPRPWNNPACGTVGCIAGAINQLAGNNPLESGMASAIQSLGCDYNDDDTYETFDKLFYPRHKWEDDPEQWNEDVDIRSYYDATPQQAAKVVRHFMNTGEVDWDKAFED